MSSKVWDKGSDHYRDFKIQPSKFVNDNELLIDFRESKPFTQDIKKAIHYCEMIIERDYE